jgi:STE24 endopeptidase
MDGTDGTDMTVIVLGLILLEYALETLADSLNISRFSPEVPKEFAGIYDPERYARSQRYQKEVTRFAIARRTVATGLLLAFLLAGGFDRVDLLARAAADGEISRGLVFVGVLFALRVVVSLPFSWFSTFRIEERYGFNRTTPRVFLADLAKGVVLGVVLGAPLFAGIVHFFLEAGESAWLYSWAALTVFQLVISFVAPVWLLPLFNRFERLPQGDLKQAIDGYARAQDFELQGIFTMDGSRRSTKANAFFTGFGKFRRLVLFDTLIQKQTIEELVAVVAHEVGHFRRGHIPKSIALSVLSSGAIFYVLSLMINNPALFEAFGDSNLSVYASIAFVSILSSPVLRLSSFFTNLLSRKFEFEADEFSRQTYGNAEALASALKKLSVDSMSHLTPHPLKVALDYSHPPVLRRIEVLRGK